MKKLILLLLMGFIFAPSQHFGQTTVSNKSYKKYKYNRNDLSLNLTLPGWLIDLGAAVAVLSTDDPQEKEAYRLMKKVKRMKVLVLEDGTRLDDQYVAGLMSKMKRDKYEDLIHVRSNGERVNVLIREDKDVIKNLFFLVRENEEAVLVSMKTKLTMDQVNAVLNIVDSQLGMNIR